MQTTLTYSIAAAAALCLLYVIRPAMAASTTDPRGMIGPSILHSDSDDEDIIVSSGHAWGSGSGHLAFDGYDQEDDEEEIPSTKATLLKLVTPDSTRMSCIVCTTVGDPSCRDPYVRNASHVHTCQTSVEGCLKVVTPSGDTYRNCLYGIFATAEKTTGCRVVKEDVHVGHKFVNATICICRTNECNGLFPIPTAENLPSLARTGAKDGSVKLLIASTKSPLLSATPAAVAGSSTDPPQIRSSVSALKYSFTFTSAVIGFFFSLAYLR